MWCNSKDDSVIRMGALEVPLERLVAMGHNEC